MSTPRLIWIVLLTSSIAAADQGPLDHRGAWALGVALPSSSGSNFSLWKIRSPTTAVGLEVGVSWSYADSTLDADASNPTSLQNHSLYLLLRPTIKHYRPLHDRVAPFMYGRVEAIFLGRKWDSDPPTQYGGSSGSVGLSLGLGVEWFPFQRISLGGQTGLRLGYRYGKYDTRGNFIIRENRNWSLSLSTFQSEVKALMYF